MITRIIASLFTAILLSTSASGAWDIWQAYLIVNVNGGGNSYWQAGLDGTDPTPSFVNNYYGRFSSGQSLILDGVEVKTYRNGSSNVCSGNAFYRVYRTCDTPGSFTEISGSFVCSHPCTGLNNPGDQKWGSTGAAANVLNGLTASGTYVIEVYWSATGGDTGGCASTKFANNGGANYRAYFEYEVTDSFTDGNFSSTPAWTGTTSDFQIVSNSDAAGLIGSESTRSQTLRLNAPGSGTDYLSTTITNWNSQQEWYFWVGRRSPSASSADQTIVWLYANEANVTSATVDGYRIVIGDDVGGDEIRLQRVDNGVGTDIFTTVQSITNNIIDYGITFKVTRRSIGRWTIETSTLPTITGAGATAWSCPESSSTVLHNNSLESGNPNYLIENTYVPPSAGTGYFGIVATSSAASTAMEFDNFRFRPLPPDTYVEISGAVSSTVAENASGFTAIALNIFNPSGTNATSVDLVLTNGSATRFGGGLVNSGSYAPSYTTLTLTWAAGESATKFFYLDPDDNNLCDDNAAIELQLQNATGGLNAYVGDTDTYSWTITDDNFGSSALVSDTFEDGNLTSPSPSWVSTPSGTYTASSTTPISGSFSMRSLFTGASGQTCVAMDMDNASLPGQTTTWRFNLQYNLEPNPANKWMVFLAANEATLWSNTVDGYALGIDPIISSDPDILTLWRIQNGVPVAAIVTTTLDWGIAQNIVGFEVTLSESGLWTLRMDSNGNFDNLVTQGTPSTDITYSEMGFFGARLIHTASNGGRLAIDDLTLDQKGCREIYYSRQTGNWTDAIWSTAATGGSAPWSTINSGRYNNIVVQAGHTVTINATVVSSDLTINGTGVLAGSSGNLTVFGNWNNNGSFDGQTSTVVMKGAAAQTIGGTSTTVFNNLTIDNDGNTVTCSSQVHAKGVVSPREGTLQTSGNLTLLSDVNGSGSIGTILSGAAVTGNITLQRYIPMAGGGWVFLGCPLLGMSLADWDDDLFITGLSDGTDGFNPPSYTFINIYSYNESSPGARNNGWTAATSVTNSLLTQRGYNVYMQGGAQTIDLTGSFQQGQVTMPVTFTNSGDAADGWNLVTNPYPSEIDWVAVETASSDVGSYYVYDSQLPGYRAYNANSQTGSASRYIAHSQSFFVKASTVGQNLIFQETHKSATNQAFERVLEDGVSEAYFRLERDGLADEGTLTFVEGATDNYEQMYDAEYLQNTNNNAPEFAFVSADNQLMEIDARPRFTETMSIPVYLDLPAAGTYTFRLVSTSNIPLGSCIAVEDVVAGTTTPMVQGSQMTIVADAAYQGNRLIIRVTEPISVSSTDATCFNAANGAIDFNAAAGNWSYNVMDDMGTITYASTGNTTWTEAVAGHYLVSLTNADAACGTVTYDVVIAEPELTQAWAEGSPALCNTGTEGFVVLGGGSGEWNYSLVNSQGIEVIGGTTSDLGIEIPGLSADIYALTIVDGCGVSNFELNLNDPNALVPEIEASATEVTFPQGQSVDVTLNAVAETAVVYNWILNDQLIAEGEQLVYTVNTVGPHVITLEVSNAQCTASTEIQINATVTAPINVSETMAQEAVTMLQRDGAIQLTFVNVSAARSEVRLYSATGQLVRKMQGSGQVMTVETEDLSRGIYSVQVVNNGAVVFTRKFGN